MISLNRGIENVGIIKNYMMRLQTTVSLGNLYSPYLYTLKNLFTSDADFQFSMGYFSVFKYMKGISIIFLLSQTI